MRGPWSRSYKEPLICAGKISEPLSWTYYEILVVNWEIEGFLKLAEDLFLAPLAQLGDDGGDGGHIPLSASSQPQNFPAPSPIVLSVSTGWRRAGVVLW